MHRITQLAGIGCASLLAAGSANAVESLTGTWTEKVRCKELIDGVTRTFSAKDALWFVDDLGDGHVYLHLSGGSGVKFHGWLEQNDAKPEQGALGLVACNPSHAIPQGDFRVHNVKTKPGQLKATMKGTSLSVRSFGSQTCTHSLVRISDEIPAVSSTCDPV
jgi:hypothetical protein